VVNLGGVYCNDD